MTHFCHQLIFCNKLLSFGFNLIFAHSENSFDAPFILYLNCIHDGHHISVLLLLEKCIVNQPREDVRMQ